MALRNNIPAVRRSTNKFLTKSEAEEQFLPVSTLTGKKLGGVMVKGQLTHKVRRFEGPEGEDRRCPTCGTKLASYNKGPNCYTHSPVSFPRVRGRMPTPVKPDPDKPSRRSVEIVEPIRAATDKEA